MKEIIHISDLHVGYKHFQDRFLSVINHLRGELAHAPSHYVIVITGDLVNDANKKGSYAEVRRDLDHLRDLGFHHVLVIPGNHDYGTGHKGSKKFVRLFQETFFGAEVEYPKVDIIDRIAFIGLDSMAAELEWYNDLWAQGQIGREQLGRLEQILHRDQIRSCVKRVIYLHHHPFKWRPLHQLRDSRKLKKVLTGAMAEGISIDALLFGHNHEGKAHNGTWGIARCYDGGTATLKPRPKYVDWAPWFQVRSSTRVIRLDQDPDADITLPYSGEDNAGKKL